MLLKTLIFSILRKLLKILLILSTGSLKLRTQYYIYYFNKYREDELFNIDKFITKKGNAIDIGCNRGLYSYALSKQKKINNIYSFEPNKYILSDLYHYKSQNIKIYNFALSSKNQIQNLIIPYFKNFELDGFATLNKKIYFDRKFKKFKKIKIKARKLDDFNFKNISFIKIDVEGHEINLLNGSKKTFRANKPDCLIEIKKGNLLKVKKYFKNIDNKYNYIPKNKFSFKLSRENYFFSKNFK